MPVILDYPIVLERLTAQGLVCNYHNSGAFAFPPTARPRYMAWALSEDSTIRPEMQSLVRIIQPPTAQRLVELACTAWQRILPGEVWAMPTSHWAYELEYGAAAWMPQVLQSLGFSPANLIHRNNGAALCFAAGEAGAFQTLLHGLLSHLDSSDFMLAFPGQPVLCMVHHHQQLWWMTTDPAKLPSLENLADSAPASR